MRKLLAILIAAVCTALPVQAVKIADITRLYGHRKNVLQSIGLVTGLKGTGDGGAYAPAMRQLTQLLNHFKNPTTEKELSNAANVAIVSITVVLPEDGWHKGDAVNAFVQSIGAATDLHGGRLIQVPMEGTDKQLWAYTEGAVTIEDASTPTGGVIKDGCVMETQFHMPYVHDGHFTLILQDPSAGWITATAIAQIINQNEAPEGRELLAIALDPKTVEVAVPGTETEHPESFISRIQRMDIPERYLANEARVQINEKTATMIITGDVEISPVVISHAGLTITTLVPAPAPTPRSPLKQLHEAVPVDTTGRGGAKLEDLVRALDQLKVPAKDRITIIKELFKTGKLHAKLITE